MESSEAFTDVWTVDAVAQYLSDRWVMGQHVQIAQSTKMCNWRLSRKPSRHTYALKQGQSDNLPRKETRLMYSLNVQDYQLDELDGGSQDERLREVVVGERKMEPGDANADIGRAYIRGQRAWAKGTEQGVGYRH